MDANRAKNKRRVRRKRGIRKRTFGTADRPRLTVCRSLRNIDAQIINDDDGVTLCSVGSRSKDVRSQFTYGGNKDAAKKIGLLLAERAKAAGISKVSFDRNGYKFHGRVRALADGAREGGLEF